MHHQRKKSGSMTDVRKALAAADLAPRQHRASRPGLSRRSTPQTAHKLGKNPRDREKEWKEERWFDEERESFPQFCMTCEKQFVPHDERFLYCSEACRKNDHDTISPNSPTTYHQSLALPHLYAMQAEPRDIIPRASPSRPVSTIMPASPPSSDAYPTPSAVDALRALSLQGRPPSPTSPRVWPFTRSAAASPSTSYTQPTPPPGVGFSSTYDAAYYTASGGIGGGGGGYGGYEVARPLPPTRNPSHYYSRPKSIELVTPLISR